MTKTSSRQLFVAFAFCFVSAAPAQAQLTTLGAVVLNGCPVPGDCGTNDQLGWTLASGDFNGDGFADLAVGIPFEDESGDANTGAVQIFYGSVAGLATAGTQVFDQASAGISGAREPDDRFGWALAVGDFGPDGFDDLAIGIPNEGIGSVGQAGAIEILRGSSAGLTTTGSLFFSQDNLPPGSGESTEFLDHFGFALAASARGDLAVGVPGECFILPNECGAGLVQVLFNTVTGGNFELSGELEQNDFLGACGALDGNELNEAWGSSVAYLRGSLNGLAVAGEREGFSGLSSAGRVTLDFLDNEGCFDQNTLGVQETAEDDDFFGRVLAPGDLTGDDFDELLIGVPFEDLASTAGGVDAGVVQILIGTEDGPTTVGDLLLRQADFPLGQETGDSEDQFGSALASGDFDGDGFGDVAIGAPGEDGDRGRAHIAYSDGDGINTLLHQTFHSDFPTAMPDTAEAGDRLGQALAAGDFDGNGTADLAIGMPGEGVSGVAGTGALTILYGLDRASGAFGSVRFGGDGTVTYTEATANHGLTVVRDGGAPVAATIEREYFAGTATPGADFNYNNGTESWQLGELGIEAFPLGVLDDTIEEGNETIALRLTNPSPGLAVGSPSTITITIQDDDEGGVVQFSAPAIGAQESVGTITVTVNRTGGAASGVSVGFTTADGSATAGQDYVATSGVLTFDANVTSRTFEVTILDDLGDEPAENFVVTLSSPLGGATLGLFSALIIGLGDDDPTGQIFLDGFESGDTSAWTSTVP